MNRRKLMMVLLLALTSGGLASYLSLARMSGTATAAPAQASAASIVVAARPLMPGTRIQAADVQQIPWAAAAPPAGMFADAKEVVGRVVTVSLGTDEPVLASLLASEGSASGLPGLIPAGKRAISVSVDKVVGVDGFMAPGTHVDVIATMEATGTGAAVSRTVLQDVEVLAAGHQLQADPNGAPQEASVATLLVTPAEAEALVLATHKGRIQLVLRGSTDRITVATPGVRSTALMGAEAARPRRDSAPRPAAAPSVRSPRAEPVEPRTPRIVMLAHDGSGRKLVRY